MSLTFDFTDRTVVVTGAAQGRPFRHRVPATCDVSDPAEVAALVDAAKGWGGPVDGGLAI